MTMLGGNGNGQPPAAAVPTYLPSPDEVNVVDPRITATAVMPCSFLISQQPLPDGTIGVHVRLLTNAGLWSNVLPAAFADELGKQLSRSAGASKAGLIVPG